MRRRLLDIVALGVTLLLAGPAGQSGGPAPTPRATARSVSLPADAADTDGAARRATARPEPRATLATALERRTAPPLRGAAPDPRAAAAPAARDGRTSALALSLLEAAGALERTREATAPDGTTHVRTRLRKRGRPVLNARGVWHERGGAPIGRRGRATLPPLAADAATLSRDAAVARALEAVEVEALRGAPRAERGWLALQRETRPAWRVDVPGLRPLGSFRVEVDAGSGDVLSVVDRLATATGVGQVYDPNRALAPTPIDVPLAELDASGYLTGRIARVYDVEALAAFRPDLAFRYPEGDPRFVQTAVYRGLTDTARLAEQGGFNAFLSPLVALVNLPDPDGGGAFNNAFYDPIAQSFGFGNGDGVITANLGTDLDVAAHEMGHHVFQELVQPEFTSLLDPILAINEGVADTFSALVGGDPNVGESTIPGQPFLRTLLNGRSFPDDFSGDPHESGLIIGGANWELMQLLGNTRFTALLLDALARLPSDALPPDYQDAFLAANTALYAGSDQAAIQAIFAARGFDTPPVSDSFAGFLENGIGQTRTIFDSPPGPSEFWNVDVWVYLEFPGSSVLSVGTDGTDDVDLVVQGFDFGPAAFSATPGTSDEGIILDGTTSPSVDVDDTWLIGVVDFPDGSQSRYTVTVFSTPPSDQIVVDGAAVDDALVFQGDVGLFGFAGAAGQIVRLEVAGLDPTLDPLAGILDATTNEVLAVDDDGGPGTDTLIQGLRLPYSGTFAVGIVSPSADIDPAVGTGRYRVTLSTCVNTGADSDLDTLADVCDDDDDGDGFVDAQDASPLDPAACSDLDADDCDDCSGGGFDLAGDGPDFDGDGFCDAGDLDDDNDGCLDPEDAAPTSGSPDGDFDFRGDDCDVCPDAFDPLQEDDDADGVGDACDTCPTLPDADQRDSDGDGFGNRCDGDFNQDGLVGGPDFDTFLQCFNGPAGTPGGPAADPTCSESDMNGDGFVGGPDFDLFLQGFNTPPG